MKLSNQGKNELRNHIVEQLKKVPNGQRVKLEKDLLEDLLFEVVTIDKEKEIKLKLPIWSGDFLKKIDLSEVDFSDVSWYTLSSDIERGYWIEPDVMTIPDAVYDKIDKIRAEKIKNGFKLSNGYAVAYDGTNANIDLTKSFEAKYTNNIELTECNFEGLDFSHQDLTEINVLSLYNTNISKTKLSIPSKMSLRAVDSEFEGIDLSAREIDAIIYFGDFFAKDVKNDIFDNCNLRDTGIHINLNPDDFKDGRFKEKLQDAMDYDWVGCYVNGKKVLSGDEKQEIAASKYDEYEKMKAEIFNSVTDTIEEQINHMKK